MVDSGKVLKITAVSVGPGNSNGNVNYFTYMRVTLDNFLISSLYQPTSLPQMPIWLPEGTHIFTSRYISSGGVRSCGYAPPPGTKGASGQINFFTNAISGWSIPNETSFGNPAYGLSDFEIANSLSYKGYSGSGRILLIY